MAKKGIIGETVRTAVTAAQKAIAPTPLAKQMIAAAATQAVGMAEARIKEALPAIEKSVRQAVKERVVEPVDSLLGNGSPEPKPAKPARHKSAGKKPATRKATGRKSAASRKKATKKAARSRAAHAPKQTTMRKSARKAKAGKTKRR